MGIDLYCKVGYNVDMVYVKKEERYNKLRQDFIDRCADRWSEYELLGDYVNKDTKTLFRHKCSNEFEMTPNNFRQGHGCPVCAQKQKSQKLRQLKGSNLLRLIEQSKGEYELIKYNGSKKPALIKHNKCGATFTRTPGSVNLKSFTGILCTVCARNIGAAKLKSTLEEANARLDKVNKEYRFITYNGSSQKAVVLHKVCDKTFIAEKAGRFIIGDGHCPYCTTNISKVEREIYEWVKTICPNAEQSVHDIPGIKEIDILVRDKGVAIEYNGHFWHSFQQMTKEDPKTGKPRMTDAEARNWHHRKSFLCEQQGIRLIHIWDYEWADERKQAVLKNIILGALGMLPERYYARDCEVHRYDIGTPEWPRLNQFFKDNNIQGNRGGTFAYTLEKDGRILMGYKFGRPSNGRAKKLYQYEMARGAAAPGVQVVGGATRLWSHFLKDVKPESLVYYVDYNYFDGKSVEKLGGKYIGSKPGVKNYWVKEQKVKNREPAHHAKVKAAIARGEVLELWNAGVKTYAFDFEKTIA